MENNKMMEMTEEELRLVNGGAAGSELYDVVLESVGSSEEQVIETIEKYTGYSARNAMRMVESAPSVVAHSFSLGSARSFADALRAAGACVQMIER